MKKRIFSFLLSICILSCSIPALHVSAENCVLDKKCFWDESKKFVEAGKTFSKVKTSLTVPLDKIDDTRNLNEKKTVLGYVEDETLYISPKNAGDTICLPENSSRLFGIPEYVSKLTEIDLRDFDTSGTTDMHGMFFGQDLLKSLDVSTFNTSAVTNLSHMFSGCSNLEILNLASFNTTNVTDVSRMFADCSSLRRLVGINVFETSKVTNMSFMFSGCNNITSLNLFRFDTSKVTDMSSMFCYCSKLKGLVVSNFNTSSVTSMSHMFQNCSSLTNLDLSNLNTEKVRDTSFMFADCSNLTFLKLSPKFVLDGVAYSMYMFRNCPKIEDLNQIRDRYILSTKCNRRDGMFDGCPQMDF